MARRHKPSAEQCPRIPGAGSIASARLAAVLPSLTENSRTVERVDAANPTSPCFEA